MFAYDYRIFVHNKFVLSVNDDHELLICLCKLVTLLMVSCLACL